VAVFVGVVNVEEVSEEEATPGAVVDALSSVPVVTDAVTCAGVEVEETNGGAFSIYVPLGCRA